MILGFASDVVKICFDLEETMVTIFASSAMKFVSTKKHVCGLCGTYVFTLEACHIILTIVEAGTK